MCPAVAARARGETRLYDAIREATQALVDFRSASKRTSEGSLRILVLSDGEDTNSTVTAFDAAVALRRAGITLDAICIGGSRSEPLRAMAKATRGYCFQPETLRDALKLCELETLLAQHERPPSHRLPLEPLTSSAQLMRFAQLSRYRGLAKDPSTR